MIKSSPMFTKRQYEVIAKIIAKQTAEVYHYHAAGLSTLIDAALPYLKEGNPYFKKEVFINAVVKEYKALEKTNGHI